jgi:hypothetical protein
MPVSEMCSRMSAKELTVDWPLYFEYRNREVERQQSKADQQPSRTLR